MKHKLTKVMHILILLVLLLPAGLQQAVGAGLANDPPPGQPVEPIDPEEDNPIYLPVMAIEAMQIYQISGLITDENDIPLSGITVRSGGGHATQTGPDGRYMLSGLSEGLQDFMVESDTYYCSPLTIKINVPPNAERRNFTCSTQLVAVSGVITDSNGDTVGGVVVTDNAGRQTTTIADGPDKGRYVLELPAGIHTLTPTSPDYMFNPSAFTVRVGSTKVRTPEDASYDFTALASAWTPANITAPLTPLPKLTDRNLAVDKSGNLHIAFDSGGAAGTSTLWYGYYDGVAWTYVQVDANAGTGQYAAIALDSRNRAHISYYDETNQRLKYARVVREINGTFTTVVRTADTTIRGGKTTSIVVDHLDDVHIIFLDDDADGLVYAYLGNPPNGSFSTESINKPAGYLDEYPSIAVNSLNVPHISFYRIAPGEPETSASLNFAYRAGEDSWVVSTLATGLLRAEVFDSLRRSPQSIDEILAGVGLFNSLAFDHLDNAHIAYYNDDKDDLEYAGGGPGYWTFDTVDKIDSVGGFASIKVDSENRPQISYIRQSQLPGSQGGALKFAIRLGDFWKTEFVDLIGPVTDGSRTNTTIHVDRADNPHILYYDFTTSDLKYVVRNKWDIQVVGLVGTLSEPSNRNVALDSNGMPHIAFGGSNLYHGFFDGSTWQFELIDASTTAGAFASIAMDWDDNIYIAYYDAGTLEDLKYAFFDRRGGFWTIETVDSSGDVGKFASLTLDSNSRPHIAYFDEDNDFLKYAYKSGSSWRIETVDDSPAVGGYPSIAMNSADRPRIAYTDFGREELRFATRSGSGTWSTSVIPLDGLVISFVSLAFDDWDRPHITFFEDTAAGDFNDNLKYVYHNGNAWVEDIIDADNSVGWWNSMRLDSFGDAHVSYYDLSSGKLKFASGSLYDWAVEFVDTMGIPPAGTPLTQVGGYTSLVLDKADRPNMVYYDITNNVLKLAKLNLWDMQTAATPAGTLQEPGRPNIAIDVAGLPHIAYGDGTINYTYNDGFLWQVNPPPDTSPDTGAFAAITTNYFGNNAWPYIAYYDTTNQRLRYNRLDGIGWLPTPIDVDQSGADVGKFASIAIWQRDNTNPQDLVIHIAYFDEDNDDLKYARLTKDGGGRVEVVDTGGSVGPYPYIALDGNGVPHISYYDIANKNLKYASRLGDNSWSTMVVDSVGKVGLFSSLAIDSHGNPHIAYFDDSYDDLRYAYYSGSTWYFEVVDTVDSTGWYASLALDSDNNPHIAYYDFSSQNLKHAFVYNYEWVKELVDIAGNVGQFSSLQTDSAGGLHIAYYDATLAIIKYVRSVDW